MILTDYLKFERVAKIAKHRLDCIASTYGYDAIELYRKQKAMSKTANRDGFAVGDLIIYWGDPTGHMRADRKRQADRCITIGSHNLSSVYNRKFENDIWFAYGDAKGTKDALLFLYHVEEIDGIIQDGSFVEVFVARGMSNECNVLCNLYEDGELDEEMAHLRKQAALACEAKKKP